MGKIDLSFEGGICFCREGKRGLKEGEEREGEYIKGLEGGDRDDRMGW